MKELDEQITLQNPDSWRQLTTKSRRAPEYSARGHPLPPIRLSLTHSLSQTYTLTQSAADHWSGLDAALRQSSSRTRDGWRLHPLRRRPQSHRLLFSGDTPGSSRSHPDRHGLTTSPPKWSLSVEDYERSSKDNASVIF